MSGTQLVRYDEACRAVQAASTIDEAKDIADKAVALKAYARQSKNLELHGWIAEIELRAKRRIGELTGAIEKGEPKNGHGYDLPRSGKTKRESLAEAGLSLSETNRCEQIAAVPSAKFEEVLAEHKKSGKSVTSDAVFREVTRSKKSKPDSARPKPLSHESAKPSARIKELADRIVELEADIADLTEKNDALGDIASSVDAFQNKDEFKAMQQLRVRLRSTEKTRDEFMAECGSQKRFIEVLKKKLKKCEEKK